MFVVHAMLYFCAMLLQCYDDYDNVLAAYLNYGTIIIIYVCNSEQLQKPDCTAAIYFLKLHLIFLVCFHF